MDFKKDILLDLINCLGGSLILIDDNKIYNEDITHIRIKIDPTSTTPDIQKKASLRIRINNLAKIGQHMTAIEQSGPISIWDYNLVFKKVEGFCTAIISRMCPSAIIEFEHGYTKVLNFDEQHQNVMDTIRRMVSVKCRINAIKDMHLKGHIKNNITIFIRPSTLETVENSNNSERIEVEHLGIDFEQPYANTDTSEASKNISMIFQQSSNLLENSVGMVNSVLANHSKLTTDLLLYSLGGSKHITEPILNMKEKLKDLTSSLDILQENLNSFLKKKGDKMVPKLIKPTTVQEHSSIQVSESIDEEPLNLVTTPARIRSTVQDLGEISTTMIVEPTIKIRNDTHTLPTHRPEFHVYQGPVGPTTTLKRPRTEVAPTKIMVKLSDQSIENANGPNNTQHPNYINRQSLRYSTRLQNGIYKSRVVKSPTSTDSTPSTGQSSPETITHHTTHDNNHPTRHQSTELKPIGTPSTITYTKSLKKDTPNLILVKPYSQSARDNDRINYTNTSHTSMQTPLHIEIDNTLPSMPSISNHRTSPNNTHSPRSPIMPNLSSAAYIRYVNSQSESTKTTQVSLLKTNSRDESKPNVPSNILEPLPAQTSPTPLTTNSFDHLFLTLSRYIEDPHSNEKPDYICHPSTSGIDLANVTFNNNQTTNTKGSKLPDYLQGDKLSPVSDTAFSPSNFLNTEFDPELFLG
jgi:hypothetical protein